MSISTARTRVLDPAATAAGHGFPPGPVEVLVDRPGRLVARVGAVVVKVDAGPDAFAGEVAANRRLAADGIAVQQVHAVSAGPPAYAVLSWIDGTGLTAASPPAAQHDAGALLRRIHARPYARTEPYVDYLAGWLDEELAWWAATGPARAAQVPAIRAWFDRLRPVLARRRTARVLLDGRPEHFIVSAGRLAGLIDPADTASGDPLMDLAVLEVNAPGLLPGVLAGYRPDPADRADLPAVLPFYLLLRRLTAIRWNTRARADLDLARRFAAEVDATHLSTGDISADDAQP